MTNICVFGASVTWGAWDHEIGGWVERLKVDLGKEEEVQVFNLGISGANSTHLVDRFYMEAKHRNPDIIIFGIGANDALYLEQDGKPITNIKAFEKNLETLIEKSKKFTDKIVFLGMYEVDEKRTLPTTWGPYYSNKVLSKYNDKIRQVCERKNIYYFDFKGILENTDLIDGIHPNKTGHKKIYKKIKDLIKTNNLLD